MLHGERRDGSGGLPSQFHDEFFKSAKTILRERAHFAKVKKAEAAYARKLKGIARQVGELADGFNPTNVSAIDELVRVLKFYAQAIAPWARATAASMLADVLMRDERAWVRKGQEMGRELRKEIAMAPLGGTYREMLDLQVNLITSLPLDAAERAQGFARETIFTGQRAAYVAEQIKKTGHVTAFRAKMIARTEVARAASALMQVRAEHIGSTGYIWRTVGDSDVRPSHKKLDGKFIEWAHPPLCDPPDYYAHAGQIFFCRCWPDPVLPEHIV